MKKPFTFLEHTADIKIRVTGKNSAELFANAAEAVTFYLAGKQTIKEKVEQKITVKGSNEESLLYQFIDQLLYLLDAESFVCARAKVSMQKNSLKATLYGDDAANYELDHIKAPTYADMKITKKKTGQEAVFVLDI